MQNPYHAIEAYNEKMVDMVDADDAAYESICEQLLTKEGVAHYHDKDGHQMAFLSKILEDYAEGIESGMDTKEVIETEARRIVESIRG